MNNENNNHRALTLVELLVAITSISVALLVLVPSLQASREENKNIVCLNNLKQLGGAVGIYASQNNGYLPGPLNAGVSRHQTVQFWLDNGYSQEYGESFIQRQLSNSLRTITGNDIDRMVTCPTMAGIVPDKHFAEFKQYTNITVLPTHYVLNSWGGSYTGSSTGNVRITDPPYYFGISSPTGTLISPQQLAAIPNPATEWMIADAWYRAAAASYVQDFQQEGPYQSAWSGRALPYYAPHSRRKPGKMYFNSYDRDSAAMKVRLEKSDGDTNTLFFDGHSAAVQSKTLQYNGFPIMYGFPGTVNPDLTSQGQTIWNNGTWE